MQQNISITSVTNDFMVHSGLWDYKKVCKCMSCFCPQYPWFNKIYFLFATNDRNTDKHNNQKSWEKKKIESNKLKEQYHVNGWNVLIASRRFGTIKILGLQKASARMWSAQLDIYKSQESKIHVEVFSGQVICPRAPSGSLWRQVSHIWAGHRLISCVPCCKSSGCS